MTETHKIHKIEGVTKNPEDTRKDWERQLTVIKWTITREWVNPDGQICYAYTLGHL